MSKKIARVRKKQGLKQQKTGSRKLVISVCLPLCLLLAAITAARWPTLPGTIRPLAPAPPGNFNANSPSKEYIYAGGRLIATEEPSNSSTVPLAPTGIIVSAISTTQISISWTQPEGASGYSYQVERSTDYSATSPMDHGFSPLITVSDTSHTDTVPSSPPRTYLYRVRSIAGQQQSAPTLLGFATTMSFQEQISNQSPPGRTLIRATHFLELKEAVDAVRAAAGLAPFNWSDEQGRAPASNVPILRTHMLDLRSALNQALTALGFTPQSYTDEELPTGTFVRKEHIDELRQRTRSVGQQQ